MSGLSSESQKSQDLDLCIPCTPGTMDLKLAHLDWNPETALIYFQGQHLTVCELDYTILQGEIQNIEKTKTAGDIGEFCLVKDLSSAHWYRGRVQNRKEGLFDVFLIDNGNILTADIDHLSSCSEDFFILPPKIVCGFLANVLLLNDSTYSAVKKYFSTLIGKTITCHIKALLLYGVFLLEAPEINDGFVLQGFARHVDTDTFLLLVEMLTEIPLKHNVNYDPHLVTEKSQEQERCCKPYRLPGYEEIMLFSGLRLSCGKRLKVRVTAAINPGLFYCQLTSMETDLWDMSKKLAAVCEHKMQENPGPLCAVKSKDKKWYRGFVQRLPESPQAEVLFIDYGYSESVKIENLRRLPSDLHSVPIMAFPCSLSSSCSHDKAAEAQQLSLLKTGLLGRVLLLEITTFDKVQHLYSVTIISAQDNHTKESELIQELPKKSAESVCEPKESSPPAGPLYYDSIISQKLVQTMEVEDVRVGSVFEGYVEHAANPNNFWLRTQKRNSEFEVMVEKMNNHFSKVKLDEEALHKPELGTLCCALYEQDMHFYRAVVIETLQSEARVLFIDFGNAERVPYMSIKKIPEIFAHKPAFSLCCTLVNVVPLSNVWTNLNCEFFRKAVYNKAFLVHVVQIRKDKVVVDLREMGGKDSQSISEFLVSSKQADIWNSIVQNKKHVTEKTDRHRKLVTPYIDGKTNWKDGEQEGDAVRFEYEKSSGATGFSAGSVKPGCEFAVCCSHINSPLHFWCQRLDMVAELEDLMSKIQRYYTTHTVPVRCGEKRCVAKSPRDGRWYRALITETQKDHARVLFVDYGFTFQIKKTHLQTIMPEYVTLDRQAFRCTLDNLKKPAEAKCCRDRNQEVADYMKKFFRDTSGHLRSKIFLQLKVEKELYSVVDLYNAQTKQIITNARVERGLFGQTTVSTRLVAPIPESFVYSSFDLKPKYEAHVCVTHLNSQWEIYCQLEKNAEVIEALETTISEESRKINQANMRSVVRKLCLAKYLDGKWYRGIVAPAQSPLHLSVFFVDYGNTNITEKANIMFIPNDSHHLLYTPMQALRFNLASVSKELLFVDAKEWLEAAVLNKQVRAVIVGKNDDGSFDIQLFDGDLNINERVRELVRGLSKPNGNEAKKTVDACDKKMQTSVKSQTLNVQKISNYSSSNDRRPTRAMPRPHMKRGNTERQAGRVATLKVSQVEVQRWNRVIGAGRPPPTTDRDVPQLSCLPNVKVYAGCRVKCFVSHIDSVHNFFLQLEEDEPALLKLRKDLNSGDSQMALRNIPSLRANDLVLAEYEEDGALYRAVVKHQEASRKSHFQIEFLDYGNSVVIEKEKIYYLPQQLLSQPRFSIPCRVMGTKENDKDAFFADAVMDKPVSVHFVCQFGTHWDVKVLSHAETIDPSATETSNEPAKEDVKVPDTLSETMEMGKPFDQTTIKVEETTKGSKINLDEEDKMNLPLFANPGMKSGRNRSRMSTRNKRKSGMNQMVKEAVRRGFMCLIQVPEDPQWKRVLVQQVDQNRCQVLLVDEGIAREVTIGYIRRFISTIPNLTPLCKMNRLMLVETKHRSETLKTLVDKEVKNVFASHSDAHSLRLVDMVHSRLFLINRILTSQQKDKGPKSPRAQTPSELARRTRASTPPQHFEFAPIFFDKLYHGFTAVMAPPLEFCILRADLLGTTSNMSVMSDNFSPLPQARPGICYMQNSDVKSLLCLQAEAVVVLYLVNSGHWEFVLYQDGRGLKMVQGDLVKLPNVTYPCVPRAGLDGQGTDEASVVFQLCLYQKNLQIFLRELVSHWKAGILPDSILAVMKLVNTGQDVLGLRHVPTMGSGCGARLKNLLEVPVSEEDNEREQKGLLVPLEGTDEKEVLLRFSSGSN